MTPRAAPMMLGALVAVILLLTAVPGRTDPTPASFTNVPAGHWAYDAVHLLEQLGFVTGYPDTTFTGKRVLTRYEFAKAILHLLQNDRQILDGDTAWANRWRSAPAEALAFRNGTTHRPQAGIGDPSPADLLPLLRRSPLHPRDVSTLEKLVGEFREELTAQGAAQDQVRQTLRDLAGRVEPGIASSRAIVVGEPPVASDRSTALERLVTEVSTGHWVYDALSQMAQRGVGTGRPTEDFNGKRALTRFQLALATQVASVDTLRYVTTPRRFPLHAETAEQLNSQRQMSYVVLSPYAMNLARDDSRQRLLRRDLDTLQMLNREFREELIFMGVDVEQQPRNLRAVKERWERLEQRLDTRVSKARLRHRAASGSLPNVDNYIELSDFRLW